MILEDTKKEFTGNVKTGFGINGNVDADFESVRGTFENNNFVMQIENDIKEIAFPAMGAGFYGVPLPLCARIMIDTIAEYLQNGCKVKNVIISLLDNREYNPFQEKLKTIGQG